MDAFVEKSDVEEVEIFTPFEISCDSLKVKGNWLILLKVINTASCCVSVESMVIEATCDHPPPSSAQSTNRPVIRAREYCADKFTLKYAESFSTLYDIDYTSTAKTEVWNLNVRISWSTDDGSSHSAAHQLSKFKIRRYPFVLSPQCDTTVVTSGQRFAIRYEMTNNFHDFLGVKLYWSPPVTDSHSSMAVVCHDPNVHLGPFPKNSTRSGIIEFQIMNPGIYELGQAMKINLRYALGGVDPVGGRGTASPRRSPRSTTTKSQSLNDISPFTALSSSSAMKHKHSLPPPDDSLTQMFTHMDDPLSPTNFLKNQLHVCVI